MDQGGGIKSRKGPDHEDISVGEIDEFQDSVHHAVPQRDQGIDGAEGKTVDHLLEKLVHPVRKS